ncbi:hypothetical protein Tco_0710039 [Tanacetum coccineum]
MFDEYFNPPSSVVFLVHIVAAPRPADPTGTKEWFNANEPAQPDNDPFLGVPTQEPSFEEFSLRDVIPTNVQLLNPPYEHINKWTKDHPIENVIGNPSRPVSTKSQLQNNALWCFFDAFLTSVKPKIFKEAMLESSWIEAIQEEIYDFEWLDV